MRPAAPNYIARGQTVSSLCTLKNTAPRGHIRRLNNISGRALTRKSDAEDAPRPPVRTESA